MIILPVVSHLFGPHFDLLKKKTLLDRIVRRECWKFYKTSFRPEWCPVTLYRNHYSSFEQRTPSLPTPLLPNPHIIPFTFCHTDFKSPFYTAGGGGGRREGVLAVLVRRIVCLINWLRLYCLVAPRSSKWDPGLCRNNRPIRVLNCFVRWGTITQPTLLSCVDPKFCEPVAEVRYRMDQNLLETFNLIPVSWKCRK